MDRAAAGRLRNRADHKIGLSYRADHRIGLSYRADASSGWHGVDCAGAMVRVS